MNKKQIFITMVGSIILSLIFVIFLSGYISATLATNTFLSRFKIFKPQSPIIINRTEEVRISDSGDIQEAVNKAKSRVSLVVTNDSGNLKVTGSAINLTSDGYFLSAYQAVVDPKAQYSIVHDNGRISPIVQISKDIATNVVVLKTEAREVQVASIGSAKDLVPGQKIVFVKGSTVPFSAGISASTVTSIERDVFGHLLRSDFPTRTFGVQSVEHLIPGQAVINLNAEIVGMWDGSQVVSSGILKNTQAIYFSNNSSIVRPSFGFAYRPVTTPEVGLLVVPGGALVVEVGATSPAGIGGLQKGDTITKIGEVELSDVVLLEEQLEKFKPADPVSLTVLRAGKTLTLNITAGTLQ